ncbi:MAG: hypothetical protein HOK97_23795 [Deltaproteobacteria bacterium]|nr:hypothetical protein [Gammaproteobacteria bacterium]MBT6492815.1 hypothetical protein [Deltaproteobacteria bacterium]
MLTNRETKAEPLLTCVVNHDECRRAESAADEVAALKPAFREQGRVTEGNSSQLSNGASVSPQMSRQKF